MPGDARGLLSYFIREPAETPDSPGFRPVHAIDHAIARLAARRHGVVTGAQLHELGLESHDIEYRLAVGRLHRHHRTTYSVGHGR